MRRRNDCRGSAMVEFALSAIPLLALFFAAFDFNYALFVRSILKFAAREGVRYAITAQTLSGMGHDASIRETVKRNSLNLLRAPDSDSKIKIRYFDPVSGLETAANSAGNLVEVAVENFNIQPMAAILWSGNSINASTSAVDIMEPFSGAPPAR